MLLSDGMILYRSSKFHLLYRRSPTVIISYMLPTRICNISSILLEYIFNFGNIYPVPFSFWQKGQRAEQKYVYYISACELLFNNYISVHSSSPVLVPQNFCAQLYLGRYFMNRIFSDIMNIFYLSTLRIECPLNSRQLIITHVRLVIEKDLPMNNWYSCKVLYYIHTSLHNSHNSTIMNWNSVRNEE